MASKLKTEEIAEDLPLCVEEPSSEVKAKPPKADELSLKPSLKKHCELFNSLAKIDRKKWLTFGTSCRRKPDSVSIFGVKNEVQ